jgi:hypothetical protein
VRRFPLWPLFTLRRSIRYNQRRDRRPASRGALPAVLQLVSSTVLLVALLLGLGMALFLAGDLFYRIWTLGP